MGFLQSQAHISNTPKGRLVASARYTPNFHTHGKLAKFASSSPHWTILRKSDTLWTSVSTMWLYHTVGHPETKSRHLDNTKDGTLMGQCDRTVPWTMSWIVLWTLRIPPDSA